jgi:hypothetical protein
MVGRCRNFFPCLVVIGFLVRANSAHAAEAVGQKATGSGTPAAQGSGAAQTPAPTVAKSEKSPPVAATAAPVEVARAKPTDGKSPSLLQLLGAHEAEVKIALVVGGVAFVLGWVCGGLYSVRRERKYRRRLRL